MPNKKALSPSRWNSKLLFCIRLYKANFCLVLCWPIFSYIACIRRLTSGLHFYVGPKVAILEGEHTTILNVPWEMQQQWKVKATRRWWKAVMMSATSWWSAHKWGLLMIDEILSSGLKNTPPLRKKKGWLMALDQGSWPLAAAAG